MYTRYAGVDGEFGLVDVPVVGGEASPGFTQVPFSSDFAASGKQTKRKPGIQDLIAFGNQARKGQFPYVASLLKNSTTGSGFYHSCGATLIASNLLLTAGKI